MGDYALPDMPYDYAALEPAITGEILEPHRSKHHAACHPWYRNVRPDYGEKLWGIVNQADVARRFSTVTSTKI